MALQADSIKIIPLTRLEGHGKIDILLDEQGNVEDCYFQVVELRGFEKFCEGRPVEELPRIMPKICGVCPGAHHIASAKAADAVYGVTPPPAGRKLREMFLNAHIAHSHMLHFFALAAPDFIPGAAAPTEKRNIFGLVEILGRERGAEVLRHRSYAQAIQGLIAGNPIHPVAALPGGMAKALSPADRDRIVTMAESLVAFAQASLDLFHDRVWEEHRSLVESDLFYHQTHYAGLVDEGGRVNFYEGKVRVIDPHGRQVALFDGADYLDHIAERVVPWSYLKVPYLKAKGYQGLVDGPQSGIYRVNSLARLNVATAMATPRAQREYVRLDEALSPWPIHSTLAYHWARLIETLFVCEEVLRLAQDPDIVSPEVRCVPTGTPCEGVGVVEAARGTLYHHYETDKRGLVQMVNLIVATAQNNAAMGMSVKKAAQGLITEGAVDEAVLDMVEMAFRAYDPCLACATHAMPGEMPLEVTIRRPGAQARVIRRD